MEKQTNTFIKKIYIYQIGESLELDTERGEPKWTETSGTLKHYGKSVGNKMFSISVYFPLRPQSEHCDPFSHLCF